MSEVRPKVNRFDIEEARRQDPNLFKGEYTEARHEEIRASRVLWLQETLAGGMQDSYDEKGKVVAMLECGTCRTCGSNLIWPKEIPLLK